MQIQILNLKRMKSKKSDSYFVEYLYDIFHIKSTGAAAWFFGQL